MTWILTTVKKQTRIDLWTTIFIWVKRIWLWILTLWWTRPQRIQASLNNTVYARVMIIIKLQSEQNLPFQMKYFHCLRIKNIIITLSTTKRREKRVVTTFPFRVFKVRDSLNFCKKSKWSLYSRIEKEMIYTTPRFFQPKVMTLKWVNILSIL